MMHMGNDQLLKEIRQLKESMSEMKGELRILRERFNDFYLSDKERKILKETIKLKKKGKLLTHKEEFG